MAHVSVSFAVVIVIKAQSIQKIKTKVKAKFSFGSILDLRHPDFEVLMSYVYLHLLLIFIMTF